ncbi:unnamed protein product [Pedinophyceae sp. YPF-701]|nr:unnamed protein product [Pedinophyceae sp. YPF-701]
MAQGDARPARDGNGEDVMWYFSFGAMCNPVAMRRRGVISDVGFPAKIQGYRLTFDLPGGFANITKDDAPDAECHGVLHAMTKGNFDHLAYVERAYTHRAVLAHPYGPGLVQGDTMEATVPAAPGSPSSALLPPGAEARGVEARVFWYDAPREVPPLPSERYVRVIALGLEKHGVDPDWIARVRRSEHRPARTPDKYWTFESCPCVRKVPEAEMRAFTVEEVRAFGQGPKAARQSVCAIGRTVVRAETTDAEYREMLNTYYCGAYIDYVLCCNIYEPALPPVRRISDMTPAHTAFALDFVLDDMMLHDGTVTIIGTLSEEWTEDKMSTEEGAPKDSE